MDAAVTENGLVLWGTPTPRPEVRAVTLTHEPAVAEADRTISAPHRMITFDLVNRDFTDIVEGSASWQPIVERSRGTST